MARVANVPCAECGALGYRGPGSLPVGQYRCRECRKRTQTHTSTRERHKRELAWLNHYRRRAISYRFTPVVESFTIDDLVAKYGDACAYCGSDWSELDHFIPIILDGPHTLANARPCCKSCNVKRGNPRMLLAIQLALLTGTRVPTTASMPDLAPVPDGRRRAA